MTEMLALSRSGIQELIKLQKEAILAADQLSATDLKGLAEAFGQ
jgi:hypothetical protein